MTWVLRLRQWYTQWAYHLSIDRQNWKRLQLSICRKFEPWSMGRISKHCVVNLKCCEVLSLIRITHESRVFYTVYCHHENRQSMHVAAHHTWALVPCQGSQGERVQWVAPHEHQLHQLCQTCSVSLIQILSTEFICICCSQNTLVCTSDDV